MMNVRLTLVILATFFLLSVVECFANYAVVLLYHRFGDPRYPSTSVSLKDFEAQMRYLKENNYNVVSVMDLLKMFDKGNIPPKTIVITIDDGYKTTMRAFKILKKFGFPFTVFIYTKAVGNYPDFLTQDDIGLLKNSGLVTFGNHSYWHLKLSDKKDLTEGELKKLLLEDLEKSEERFEELVGEKPKIYAFPYGQYCKLWVDLLSQYGYALAFSQDPGSIDTNYFRYTLPRRAIVGSWSTLSHFKKILDIHPLKVKEFYPSFGFCPYTVRIKLKLTRSYKKCMIYISEYGWLNPIVNVNWIYLDKDVDLHYPQRIGASCWDEAERYDFFWFVIPSIKKTGN